MGFATQHVVTVILKASIIIQEIEVVRDLRINENSRPCMWSLLHSSAALKRSWSSVSSVHFASALKSRKCNNNYIRELNVLHRYYCALTYCLEFSGFTSEYVRKSSTLLRNPSPQQNMLPFPLRLAVGLQIHATDTAGICQFSQSVRHSFFLWWDMYSTGRGSQWKILYYK